MKTGGCIIVIVGVLFTTQTPVSLDSMIKYVRLRMNVYSVYYKTLYLLLSTVWIKSDCIHEKMKKMIVN